MSDKTTAVLAGVIIVAAAALFFMGVAAVCALAGLVEIRAGGVAIVAIPTVLVGQFVARLVWADIRGDR